MLQIHKEVNCTLMMFGPHAASDVRSSHRLSETKKCEIPPNLPLAPAFSLDTAAPSANPTFKFHFSEAADLPCPVLFAGEAE
jgi:hypothetical protein